MNTLPLLDLRITSKSASVDAEKRKGEELEAPSPKRTLTSEEKDWIQRVSNNPYSLYFAPFDLRNSKEFVLAVVRQNPFVLQYASEAFHADKKFMLAAVQKYGLALDLSLIHI